MHRLQNGTALHRGDRSCDGMPQQWIIDGYNLMHAAGYAQVEYGPHGLRFARERLLQLIESRVDESSRSAVLVVFDAREPPPDRSDRQTIFGFAVRFSRGFNDADAFIEEWLEQHAPAQHVLVVSSDKRLKIAARRSRSQWMSCDDFLGEIDAEAVKLKQSLDRRAARSRSRKESAGNNTVRENSKPGSRPQSSAGGRSADRSPPAGGMSPEEVARWVREFEGDATKPDSRPGSGS